MPHFLILVKLHKLEFYHVQARSCLRKKHALDSCADKRTSALENIQSLLTHIEEAKSNAEVRKNMHRLYQIRVMLLLLLHEYPITGSGGLQTWGSST
jgi:hypothetical protein